MRKTLLSAFVAILVFASQFASAQITPSSMWTWMKGSNSEYQYVNIYGTQGIANNSNTPSGRYSPVSWKDNAGNLWLFGGQSYNSSTGSYARNNDLWKHNPSTNQWAWIKGNNTNDDALAVYGTKGVAAVGNTPGGREGAITWLDLNGNLWLFGGYGLSSNSLGHLNDLWKYNPFINQWTWMSGDNTTDGTAVYGTIGVASSSNKPASRRGATGWRDLNGDLWLYGGVGNSYEPNLWKYDLSTNQWTCFQNGSTTNTPGYKSESVGWTDAAGKFYLFGGYGTSTTNSWGYHNDLWKYDPVTKQWAFIGGSNSAANMSGQYGTQGVTSATNWPGSRQEAVALTDQNGNFWLMGGYGYGSSLQSGGHLNDLWKFDPVTVRWTWVKGEKSINISDVYGTQEVTAQSNRLGSSYGHIGWVDNSYNLWFFGGQYYENSLWKLGSITTTFYRDADGDGYGNPDVTMQATSAPTGYVANNTDCNDEEKTVYIGAPELCDGKDNDCDGTVDDGLGTLAAFYLDADADGYGTAQTYIDDEIVPIVYACAPPQGYVENNLDCDDWEYRVNPGATEGYEFDRYGDENCRDGLDNDCNGEIDDMAAYEVFGYEDEDGDGFGEGEGFWYLPCDIDGSYAGWPPASVAGDCVYWDSNSYPGAPELCDGLDNDCDGLIDEGLTSPEHRYYQDWDNDGYGSASDSGRVMTECEVQYQNEFQGIIYVLDNSDCNDASARYHPDAQESCDRADYNCNGVIDDVGELHYADRDYDGYGDKEITSYECELMTSQYNWVLNSSDCNDDNDTVYPGAPELPDGLDNDCDGLIDEGFVTTKSLKVNLFGGVNAYANTEWNNWNVSSSLSSGVLKYSDASSSNITAALTKSDGINDNGTTYGTGVAPAEVLRYSSSSSTVRTLTLSGLASNKYYSLELYASRNSSSGSATLFTIAGAGQSVSTYKNLVDKALYSNLVPSAEGQIVVNIQNLNAYNYLNGFVLTESGTAPTNAAPTVSAGEDKTITLPASSVALSGSGSDGDGSLYKFTWSKLSGPSSFVFSSRTTATPTVSSLLEGTYTFRLTATDNQGATSFGDVQVVVQNAATATAKYVKVNLFGGTNPYNNAEWNNWNVSASLSTSALKYSDGTASTATAIITKHTLSDNGSTYGGTMAPPEVLRYSSYGTGERTLTLSGLTPGKTYSLELYASRANTGNSTLFTTGSVGVTVLTDNNKTTKATFLDLAPTADGKILLSIKSVNTYNYLNGFILTENGGTAANAAPTANAGGDKTITLPTSSVSLNGSGADSDGTIASYNWTKVSGPAPFTFSSSSVAAPTVSGLTEGTYTFRLTVTDNGGATATDDVVVVVNGAPVTTAKAIKVNIYGGSYPYTNAAWNNWNVKSSLTTTSLKWADGTTSTASAVLSKSEGLNDNEATYGGTIAPPEVLRHSSSGSVERTLTLSGIPGGKTYSLELFASRNGTGNATTFTLGSSAITLVTDNNKTNSAVFQNLVPTAQGELIVSIKNVGAWNYVNGFVLTQNEGAASNQPPVVSAGGDKNITLPTSSVTLNGSASDADGTITTYNWSKVSGPSQFTINTPAAASTAITSLTEGTYTFRLTATDNGGASTSDEVQVVVAAAPVTTGTKFIKVNLFGGSNPYNNAEWNNWNVSASLSSGVLKYPDATVSSISAAITKNTLADNGATYGGTMAPPEVLRYTSYGTTERTLTISGLSTSKVYSIELYASRANTGNSTTFIINGSTQSVVTDNNKSTKVSFVNLSPTAGGQILVSIKNVNAYNYLNGFILGEQAPPPPPVTKALKVNLFGGSNPYNNAEWNNWNVSSSLNSGVLKYPDASVSSVSASLTRHTLGDNGATYGGTMAPPEVLRYSSYSTSARTLTISGLSTSKTNSLELYASRANTGNTTVFSAGGQSQSVLTDNNKSTKVSFTNLTPSAGGQILVSISNTNSYNYLNGFILTEISSGAVTQNKPAGKSEGTLAASSLKLTASPNPSKHSFVLAIQSGSVTPVDLKVLDAVGRVLETKQNIPANSKLLLGQNLKPGIYYAEITQGKNRKTVKLIKIAE